VLVQAGRDVAEPHRVDLTRSLAKPAGRVPGADSLTASPGRGLVVGTAEGKLVRQAETLQWTEIGDGRTPAYPG
jgi:hypothetical protein